jgi:hypothetical protein
VACEKWPLGWRIFDDTIWVLGMAGPLLGALWRRDDISVESRNVDRCAGFLIAPERTR